MRPANYEARETEATMLYIYSQNDSRAPRQRSLSPINGRRFSVSLLRRFSDDAVIYIYWGKSRRAKSRSALSERDFYGALLSRRVVAEKLPGIEETQVILFIRDICYIEMYTRRSR